MTPKHQFAIEVCLDGEWIRQEPDRFDTHQEAQLVAEAMFFDMHWRIRK